MSGSVVVVAATLILANGKIWTGDGFANSVLIEGNRIVAVEGPSSGPSLRSGPGTKVIDLRGRLAVPGFIDNHVHFIEGGFQLSRVQLRDAASPEEFARRIAAHTKKIGPGKWIVGGEWDEQLWQPYQLPTRAMIDEVTKDNPVFVSRLDGHMALANTEAMKAANVGDDVKDVDGGEIVRDAARDARRPRLWIHRCGRCDRPGRAGARRVVRSPATAILWPPLRAAARCTDPSASAPAPAWPAA